MTDGDDTTTADDGGQSACGGDDPLLDRPRPWGRRVLSGVATLVGGVALHVIGAVLLVTLAPMCNVDSSSDDNADDSIVEMAVVEETEPPPESKPKLEPTQQFDPKPEPRPKPEPSPSPKPDSPPPPKPDSPPPPKPDSPPPPEPESPPAEPESMDPVHLDGLTQQSTTDSADAPAFKSGAGINTGKVSDKYVDPNADIQTGDGRGRGHESGDSPATGRPSGGPTRKPKAVRRPKADPADYPIAAKRRGVGGTVVAILTVDKQGAVTEVKIVSSAGHGFDELAEQTFRKWRFEPALQNGEPVEDTIRATHVFEIDH